MDNLRNFENKIMTVKTLLKKLRGSIAIDEQLEKTIEKAVEEMMEAGDMCEWSPSVRKMLREISEFIDELDR